MNAVFLCGLALAAGQVARPATPTEALKNLLATPISVEFDQVPLGDAVSYLRDRYNVPITIDKKAFRDEFGVKDVETKCVALAKVDRVPLGQVLQVLLDQVRGTHRIDKDKLLIVPVLLR
jgi:hypothetical protein